MDPTPTPASGDFARAVGRVIVRYAARIHRLHAGTHEVTPAGLTKIGELIQRQVIRVDFQNRPDRDGCVANHGGQGFLVLRSPENQNMVFYRARILHEATHATWYLKGHPYRINSLVDEALAFVVEAMVLYREGVLTEEVETGDDPMLVAAYPVAKAILSSGHPTHHAVEALKHSLVQNRYVNEPRVYRPVKIQTA
jgi:hypothetical protein